MPKEAFVLTLVLLVGVFGLASTIVRAVFKARMAQPGRPDDRLERIAQQLATLQESVDTTAIEVERLGEGTAVHHQLLAERSPGAMARQQPPERVITPH